MRYDDAKIEGNTITLTKEELIEVRDHYLKVADKFKPKKKDKGIDFRYGLYLGKADVLVDLIKMFDPPIDFV